MRAADRVVVCSPAFSQYAASLGVEPTRIETIYNWVILERVAARSPREHTRPTRFLYAGNLGYSQGFDTLIEACRTTWAMTSNSKSSERGTSPRK